MTADIRRQMEQIPFEPFTIRMSDGHEYPVPTTDHIYLPPGGTRIVVSDDEGAVAVLPVLHMTGVIRQPAGK
jgi:hypothetical protein